MNNLKKNTKNWVKEFVIKLNLCPFAEHPFRNNLLRFQTEGTANTESQLTGFWKEVELLEHLGAGEISNTLLIFPNGLEDFEDFLDFTELCERLLEMQNQHKNYQLAGFHPDYQFAEVDFDDPRNYTNRSPYPMIHILRTEEVEQAIKFHPNTLEIPENNKRVLEKIGTVKIKEMIADILK